MSIQLEIKNIALEKELEEVKAKLKAAQDELVALRAVAAAAAKPKASSKSPSKSSSKSSSKKSS